MHSLTINDLYKLSQFRLITQLKDEGIALKMSFTLIIFIQSLMQLFSFNKIQYNSNNNNNKLIIWQNICFKEINHLHNQCLSLMECLSLALRFPFCFTYQLASSRSGSGFGFSLVLLKHSIQLFLNFCVHHIF